MWNVKLKFIYPKCLLASLLSFASISGHDKPWQKKKNKYAIALNILRTVGGCDKRMINWISSEIKTMFFY